MALRERFGPSPGSVPVIEVELVQLSAYDELATIYTVDNVTSDMEMVA